MGSAAIHLAKYFGAKLLVCAAHIELVKPLGADEVIDYGREDFTMAQMAEAHAYVE